MQDATGIEDIDQLVNTFLAAEDQNYTLFNYVNEVNQEIEKLEDQINIMRGEINKYRCVMKLGPGFGTGGLKHCARACLSRQVSQQRHTSYVIRQRA